MKPLKLMLALTAALTSWWALLALAGVAYLVPQVVAVLRGATGLGLIPALKASGVADLLAAIGLAVGLLLAGR